MKSQELFDSPNNNQVTPLNSPNDHQVTSLAAPNTSQVVHYPPERVVLLKRPVFWSYMAASLMVGAGIAVGAWGAIARFDQTIPATGTVELQGTVTQVQAPALGVVQEIFVKDWEAVEAN